MYRPALRDPWIVTLRSIRPIGALPGSVRFVGAQFIYHLFSFPFVRRRRERERVKRKRENERKKERRRVRIVTSTHDRIRSLRDLRIANLLTVQRKNIPSHYVRLAGKAARHILTDFSGWPSEQTDRAEPKPREANSRRLLSRRSATSATDRQRRDTKSARETRTGSAVSGVRKKEHRLHSRCAGGGRMECIGGFGVA